MLPETGMPAILPAGNAARHPDYTSKNSFRVFISDKKNPSAQITLGVVVLTEDAAGGGYLNQLISSLLLYTRERRNKRWVDEEKLMFRDNRIDE